MIRTTEGPIELVDPAPTEINDKTGKPRATKKPPHDSSNKHATVSNRKKKKHKSKLLAKGGRTLGRKRKQRPYPVAAFNQATTIGEAIHKYAAGEKIRRMTLLEKLQISPTSSGTQMMITNSSKYKITTGSFVAEWLELTPQGKIACDPDAVPRAKLEARFALAINGVEPFRLLYDEYKGKKLVAREVMHDLLKDAGLKLDYAECVDIFVANVKDLGLLRTIAGSENLIPIEQALDEAGQPLRWTPIVGQFLVLYKR